MVLVTPCFQCGQTHLCHLTIRCNWPTKLNRVTLLTAIRNVKRAQRGCTARTTIISLDSLVCPPLYNLAFRINKNNVSISGSEAWGDESTQHAPLRSHSRLPQLLSISRIFSNYIWNTITHTTHASMYNNSLVSNTLNPPRGLSAFCWWPLGVLRLGSWAACLPGETNGAF